MFHLRDVYLGCEQIHIDTSFILDSPLKWLDYVDSHRATLTWAPNFAFALINNLGGQMESKHWDLSCLRFLVNAGEMINAQVARTFLGLLQPFGLPPTAMKPVWGMSETSSGVTYSDHFGSASEVASSSFVEVGQPIPGTSLRIVDGDGQIVEEGRIGRLQTKGLTVTQGYFRRPELNKAAFDEQGWFETGDLGFLRRGRLTITGRAKDIIIVNGVHYYSHEVEAVAEEVDGVDTSSSAVAFGVRLCGNETDEAS